MSEQGIEQSRTEQIDLKATENTLQRKSGRILNDFILKRDFINTLTKRIHMIEHLQRRSNQIQSVSMWLMVPARVHSNNRLHLNYLIQPFQLMILNHNFVQLDMKVEELQDDIDK
jgi:hypothetical protein